jgi:hypothetical protein
LEVTIGIQFDDINIGFPHIQTPEGCSALAGSYHLVFD